MEDSSDWATDEGPVGRKGLGPPAWSEIKLAELLSKTGNLKEIGCRAGSTDKRLSSPREAALAMGQVRWLRESEERVLTLWGPSQKNAHSVFLT